MFLESLPRAAGSFSETLKERSPNMSLNYIPKKCRSRNKLHLDLYTDHCGAEVDRLLRIGAILHRQRYKPNEDFRVLEDPDGNLFCVVQKTKTKAEWRDISNSH